MLYSECVEVCVCVTARMGGCERSEKRKEKKKKKRDQTAVNIHVKKPSVRSTQTSAVAATSHPQQAATSLVSALL